MDSDIFAKRTDEIVRILRDDPDLGEMLPYAVDVYKGPRLNATGRGEVWVWRSGVDDTTYTEGGAQIIFEGTWAVACVTRWAMEPDVLEDYVSILAANVYRCLAAHALNPGYWGKGLVGGNAALPTIRDTDDQAWEIDIIDFLVEFEETI